MTTPAVDLVAPKEPREGAAFDEDESILTALAELDRWRARQESLREELARVNRQVAYYEALVRDMKREARPSRLKDLLRAMS